MKTWNKNLKTITNKQHIKFNFYSINHALVNTPAIFYNGIQITTSKIKLIGKQKFLFQIYHNQAEQERVGLKVIKTQQAFVLNAVKFLYISF